MVPVVSEASSDSPEEFVGLLTNFQADLWAYLLALMPGHPDVADVLQKANVVLWAKRGKFEPGTDFRAWAFAVARYEVKAHLKTMSRRPFSALDDDLLECLADEAPEVIAPALSRLEALEHCLSRLRPEDRRLLEHRYQSGRSLEEYAQATKRSLSGLSVSLFRLRAALRRCIEGELLSKGPRP